MDTITIVINTYNEEKNITTVLSSAKKLTENIIVVDMESTDQTPAIVRRAGVKMYTFPFSHYVEPAREFALDKVTTPWVLILDCDERLSNELVAEIKTKIASADNTHYKIPRENRFLGKQWLQHGGWYPDYVIRLIKKDAFLGWSKDIHSSPNISGSCGYLSHPFVHLFHPDFENMVEKTSVYEEIEAQMLYQGKKSVSVGTFFRKFAGELYRRLLKNNGWRDGTLGIIESFYQAYSKTITYIFLYEKYTKGPSL